MSRQIASIGRALLLVAALACAALANAVPEDRAADRAGDRAGELEGTYRVGGTTCRVTPVKMAFEVRWARGTGSMMFFYEWPSPFGEWVFVSEAKPGGFDRFIFADHHLTTGVFVRADGARFPVHKARSD